MDDLTIILIVGMILAFASFATYLIVKERSLARKERISRTAAANRMRTVRGAAHAAGEEINNLGPWVADLLESLGADPEVLFEEEMPEELARLLPLAKGFLKSGGLEKLMKGPGGPPEGGDAGQSEV